MAKHAAIKVHGGRFTICRMFRDSGSDVLRARVTDNLRTRELKDAGGKVVKRAPVTYRFSTGRTKEKEAAQYVHEWLEKLLAREQNEPTGAVKLPVGFAEWLAIKKPELRPPSYADLKLSCERVYEKGLGDLYFHDVDVRAAEEFLGWLTEKRGCAARTRQKHLSCLRAIWKWALRRKYVTENPWLGLKVGRGERFRPHALDVDALRRLVRAAGENTVLEMKSDRRGEWKQTVPTPTFLRDAILVAALTGLRKKNVFGLRWRHVDLDGKVIGIPASEMKGKAKHEVPIHPELLEVFRQRLHGRQRVDAEGLVLGATPLRFDKSFASALRRAELPEDEIRFHDLRHSFGTLVAAVASFAVTQTLMGHAPGNVTLLYTHPSMDDLRAAIEKLPRLLAAGDGEGKARNKAV